MKIGVLDSDGNFDNIFFNDKKIKIIRKKCSQLNYSNQKIYFTHGEYVCAHILKENPEAEIVLVPIIYESLKCSVRDMIDGLYLLMDEHVDIINLSIGNEYKFHRELEEVCKLASKKGILIIAAHSNREVEATYPADFPYVLGVKCFDLMNASKIIDYNSKENEILFSTSFFSIYHLGIPKLIRGNSFACARITGQVSCSKMKYQSFLMKYQKSIFNEHYPYSTLKKKRCLFITNRINDPLEQNFIENVTNSVECLKMEEGLKCKCVHKEKYDLIFIDHNCYKDALVFKNEIITQCIQNSNMEIVLRYPLFNLIERMKLYENSKIVINQFLV